MKDGSLQRKSMMRRPSEARRPASALWENKRPYGYSISDPNAYDSPPVSGLESPKLRITGFCLLAVQCWSETTTRGRNIRNYSFEKIDNTTIWLFAYIANYLIFLKWNKVPTNWLRGLGPCKYKQLYLHMLYSYKRLIKICKLSLIIYK